MLILGAILAEAQETPCGLGSTICEVIQSDLEAINILRPSLGDECRNELGPHVQVMRDHCRQQQG